MNNVDHLLILNWYRILGEFAWSVANKSKGNVYSSIKPLVLDLAPSNKINIILIC